MKLIIDISENLYKATVNGLEADEIWDLRLAVKNGTPLDDVKAEINKNIINEYTGQNEYEIALSDGLELALQIIDKHISGKENYDPNFTGAH